MGVQPGRATTTLKAQLTQLDVLLREKLPGLAASLRPPANRRALTRLARLFGGKLPPALETWFSWHDGQRDSSFVSLLPGTRWRAMPAGRIVDAHRVLSAPDADVMQPWRPSWVPLFENGGGDHLCWDRTSGAVIVWFHDDASRPRQHRRFDDVVKKLLTAYGRMKKPNGFPPPDVKAWTRVATRPGKETLAKLPVGTALGYVARLNMGRLTEIALKLSDDRWIQCSGRTRAEALEEWKRFSRQPPAPSSGYYIDDNELAYQLASYASSITLAR